ncbi:MAG TPA: FISUMP domain-containing protein [Candidatus Elarobacter sp.]|jgi:hypothetical protein|nr:FISUMP domain-containing protein [Candidatus Elarobacter sp.]
MAGDSAGFGISLVNPATGNATVYSGVTATLDVTLTNGTGGAITLVSGGTPSTLTIFMPTFYDATALQAMKIALDGWTCAYDASQTALVLTFGGADGTQWSTGTSKQFSIANAATSAAPDASQSVQINPAGMQGAVPDQVLAPLILASQPQPGNASLVGVLDVSLESLGVVYVSPSDSDPLPNTLFLNLKNMASQALYSGTAQWTGSPTVTVRFVYGTVAGALAPNEKPPPGDKPVIGSAWNIKGGIQTQPLGWTSGNPDPTSSAPEPVWTFAPASTNLSILGPVDGADANVTLKFENVVSITIPGHTQMIVDFKNFMKDETTPYNEQVYVLDVVKQSPPPTRGIVEFSGSTPVVTVTDPAQAQSIALKWTMFEVPAVNIITGFPGVPAVPVAYPKFSPLGYGWKTMRVPPVPQSMPVTFTAQALDGAGNYLNSQQFTVFFESQFFHDQRDGKNYPTLLLPAQNKIWLAANLDYALGDSLVYGTPEATYGRLYTYAAAQNAIPPGWRIPTADDWNELFGLFTYAQLIAGGSSGFNAQLGGWYTGSYGDFLVRGYYWSTSPGQASTFLCATFSSVSSSVSVETSLVPAFATCVRLVQDI